MVDNHAYSHRRRLYALFLDQERCLFVAQVLTHTEATATVNRLRLISLRIKLQHFYQLVSDRLRLSKHVHIWLRLKLMRWCTYTMLIRRRITIHRLAFVRLFGILLISLRLTVSRFVICRFAVSVLCLIKGCTFTCQLLQHIEKLLQLRIRLSQVKDARNLGCIPIACL